MRFVANNSESGLDILESQLMNEQWRDVVGYEGMYQVSDLGLVRSVDRIVSNGQYTQRRVKSRILRPALANHYGHLLVTLSRHGIQVSRYVHQLVAAAWIGPCPDGQQVRHGPNGKLDNSVSNLCYGTRSEDQFDRRRDGTHGGRPVRRSDGIEFINMSVAAEEMGCSPQAIWRACNSRYNRSGGYDWEYI